jgi:hypothetical protein
MKSIFTIPLLLLSFLSFSQDSSIALSRFEEFSSRSGVPLKRESKSVGSIRGIRVFQVRTTDLLHGDVMQAINLTRSMFADEQEPLIGVGKLYIDLQDTASLLQALEAFSGEIKKGNTSLVDFTLSYTTSNDVRFYVNYEHTSVSPWDLRVGQQFRHLRSMVPGSVTALGRREIDDLIFLIRAAGKPF